MHADLSRVTFRPGRHYSAVLAQQGRVQLDADANEQADIQLHLARTTAADLIGPHGGPAGATGFAITYVPGAREPDDLRIGGGRYYVDGILCDADRPPAGTAAGQPADGAAASPPTWTYWEQPDAWLDPERAGDRLPETFPYLVHLAVWERAVTAAEDPGLREVALGAALPDTAARRRVVWQVRALTADALGTGGGADEAEAAFERWVRERTAPASRLAVRAEQPADTAGNPCATSPDSRYRGAENQLYRIEVHRGGAADGTATYKWSRENGSVVLPVTAFDGTWAELAALGGDDRLDVAPGDRVEVVDSAYTERGQPADLPRVEEVDVPGRRVRLSREPEGGVGRLPERHPFLRRWDHRVSGRAAADGQGALRIEEGRWTDLEDGVQIWFEPGGAYRPGDWWTVPARTATGGVEWPHDGERGPLLLPPAGIEVHYAPLAWVRGERAVLDLRRAFGPLAALVATHGDD